MIYNYTKCESVIAKIMADLDSSEVAQRTTDIREWIFEAVDKIGAPMQYISKEAVFEICDHQIPLPDGLQVLDGAAYSETKRGRFKLMSTNTSVFKEPKHHPHFHHHQPEGHKIITSQSQFYTLQDPKIKALYEDKGEPKYFIKPGWLVVNRPHGFVKLAYKTIATDERGYPLIPDTSSYQEAVYWYVVMKLNFPKLLSGELGGNVRKGVNTGYTLYAYMQQQWNFYRNQAYAEAMMPTADDMEAIRNDWNKLIPEYDSRLTSFENQGSRETIINDYYYGY